MESSSTARGLIAVHKQYGRTLIEQCLVLLVIGIVISLSSSQFLSLYEKNQLQVRANTLQEAVTFAKLYAQAHRETVLLQPLDGGQSWSSGLVLRRQNLAEIRRWPWRSGIVSVSWKGFRGQTELRFSSYLQANAVNGRFELQTKHAGELSLMVNRVGRVRFT